MPVSAVPTFSLDPNALFARRADGRTVFYTNPNRVLGYVIDTPERERALRSYAWYESIVLPFVYPLIVMVGIPLLYLAALYPAWAVLCWIAGIAAPAALVVWECHRLNRLVVGLEKIVAPGATPRPFHKRRVATVAIVLIAIAFWIYATYRPEVDAAAPDGSIAYYSDITVSLFFTTLFAILGFVVLDGRKAVINDANKRPVRGVLAIGIALIVSGADTAMIYANPSPKILIRPT